MYFNCVFYIKFSIIVRRTQLLSITGNQVEKIYLLLLAASSAAYFLCIRLRIKKQDIDTTMPCHTKNLYSIVVNSSRANSSSVISCSFMITLPDSISISASYRYSKVPSISFMISFPPSPANMQIKLLSSTVNNIFISLHLPLLIFGIFITSLPCHLCLFLRKTDF